MRVCVKPLIEADAGVGRQPIGDDGDHADQDRVNDDRHRNRRSDDKFYWS